MRNRTLWVSVLFAVAANLASLTGIALGQPVVERVVVPSGTLDASFDTDGRFFLDFGQDDHARGVAIQPDGKVVVVRWR